MSRFVDLDRVDIRLLGHDREDPSRKAEFQYAFEAIDPDVSKLTASIEPGFQEVPDPLMVRHKPDGTIARFSIEGEGLRAVKLEMPPEPYEAILFDALDEAIVECRRCEQRIDGVEYTTHTLGEFVRAANEHLKTCRPVEES